MKLRTREITPDNPTKGHCDTVRRSSFFTAVDLNNAARQVSARELFQQHHVPKSTAYRWLHDRNQYGAIASRRSDLRNFKSTSQGSTGSGRPYKIPDSQLRALINADQNSRRQKLQTQLRQASIQACRETLRTSLKNRFSAGMFKAAKQRKITTAQQAQRVTYTYHQLDKPILGFWDGVVFTDEAHCSLTDFPEDWILRVFGERLSSQNVVEEPNHSSYSVHFAAWINYYDRAPHLTFYNDEYDDVKPVKPPPKPRRRPATETEEQYRDRLRHWEASKPRDPDISRPGNSMRASYYTDKLLPIYRDAMEELEARSDDLRGNIHRDDRYNWYIVEDNDPSHGTKNPESEPAIYRSRAGMRRLYHPANSPDLNPIEGIWNIIKARIKQQIYDINSVEELKIALQREWAQITQKQIRDRIDEMGYRCREVWLNPGKRCKTQLW